MLRDVNVEDIWDGRYYDKNELVKAGCNDCEGCFDCCKNMNNTIFLDPYDMFRLNIGTKKSFEELINADIKLSVDDGLIIPTLAMDGDDNSCTFLGKDGRCTIHQFRPGICRLFPLARIYDNESGGHRYFLQANECPKNNKTKVKVKKWIDTPDFERYDEFIDDWHDFLQAMKEIVRNAQNEKEQQDASLVVLNFFYARGFELEKDFYEQFYSRMTYIREKLFI